MKDYKWYNCFLRDWVEVQVKLDETEAAWNSFMSYNSNTKINVSPEILSSWMRCKEKGLDPYDTSTKVLSSIELNKRIESNKAIINEMEPIIHEITGVMLRALTRIDFYDSDLYLIARFGGPNDTDVQQLGVRDMSMGMSAKEQDCGTMAVNLCALLLAPIELRAREHYRDQYSFLHDAAVPIVNRRGQCIGVLAMEAGCWPLHKYTLATLILLKRIIENRIFGNSENESYDLIRNINSEIIEKFDSAILFTDSDGRIAGANNKAKELLFNSQRHVNGFFCDTVFGQRNAFSSVLNSKRPLINQDLLLNTIEGVPKMFHGSIKPIIGSEDRIEGVMGTFYEKKSKKGQNKVDAGTKVSYDFSDIIYTSAKMHQVIVLARETAKIQSNVLIYGESGTGKELFAQSIHNNSPYAEGPFMAINCSAIPEGLFESELFGYEGGAFTGSKKEGEIGKLEIASGGTVFLDEINSMPLGMQAKILRVLQEKSITRVGGTKEIPINVRIIAASNVNLWELVMKNEFREDFYYRINIIGIVIPPLRERKEDIQPLTQYLLNKISLCHGHYYSIYDDAVQLLQEYDWPGNVRELENVLERCVVIAKTKNVDYISSEDIMGYYNLRTSIMENNASNHITQKISASQDQSNPNASMAAVEKEIICRVLEANHGNISATAKEMGIARNTLYRKLERFGINSK